MIDIVIILILLYMVSFVLNFGFLFAFLQRSGPKIFEAHETIRMVKDIRFSILMSLVGFLGTPFILFHTYTQTSHRFTGFLLMPSSANSYWKDVADVQHQRYQQDKHHHNTSGSGLHFNNSTGRVSIGGSSHRFATYGSTPPPPPRMKHERAENDTDGRCKSIWD